MTTPEKPKPFSMIREFHLADGFTLGNAVCGVGALFSTITHLESGALKHLCFACALLVAALIFDVFDGRVARWRQITSALGRELAANEYARLQDDLEQISLKLGELLFNPGDSMDFVHSPITCIASPSFTTRNGASAELAIIGNEGLVGIPLVLGGTTTNHCLMAQSDYRSRRQTATGRLDPVPPR